MQVSQVCEMETFAFFAITFEPIGILTHSAHQNDCLNLSFVKDNHTGSQKMAINGSKTAIYFVIFISKQSLGIGFLNNFSKFLLILAKFIIFDKLRLKNMLKKQSKYNNIFLRFQIDFHSC